MAEIIELSDEITIERDKFDCNVKKYYLYINLYKKIIGRNTGFEISEDELDNTFNNIEKLLLVYKPIKNVEEMNEVEKEVYFAIEIIRSSLLILKQEYKNNAALNIDEYIEIINSDFEYFRKCVLRLIGQKYNSINNRI